MKTNLTIKIVFLAIAASFYGVSIRCACLDEVSLNTAESACDDNVIIGALKIFPQLESVEYQIGTDLTKDRYWTSLCIFNNCCLKKVIDAIGHYRDSEKQIDFIDFANNRELQDEIAHLAKIDHFYVRLYISRAIAWHIQMTEDPNQAVSKIRLCRNFWNNDQLYLLRSLLHIEDLILVGLSKIQESLTNLAFYASQSADLLSSGDTVGAAACRKIRAEHLPYTCIMLRYRTAHLYKKFLDKIPFDKRAVMQPNFCVREMVHKKEQIVDDVNKAFTQSSDPCLQKVSFSLYHHIYIWLLWQYYAFIYVNYSYMYNCLTNVSHWHVPPANSLVKKQIASLIQSIAMPDGSIESHELTLKNHYLTLLLEMFLDYQGLSLLNKMPRLIRLVEDINTIYTQTIVHRTDANQTSYATVEQILEHTKGVRSSTVEFAELLRQVNRMMEEYGTDSFSFESAFSEEFAQCEGKMIDPIFNMDCTIEKGRINYALLAKPVEKGQPALLTTQPTIDYLMRTYFPEEQSNGKALHQNSKKSKKSKKSDNALAHEKKNTTNVPDENDELVSTVQTSEPASQENKSIIRRYHNRVLRWFEPQFACRYKQESVIYHTLPPFIDTYLEKEGLQDVWNGNRRFSLPAKITRQDGSCACVICSCTITKDGQIYHRGFEFTTGNDIKHKFGIAIPEDNFALNDDEYKEDPFVVIFKNKRLQNRSLLLDDNKSSVMLYDPINKLYVQLFHRHAS